MEKYAEVEASPTQLKLHKLTIIPHKGIILRHVQW
jgi:hypothetical protein